MFETLEVPPFARAAEYAGLWAIEPTRGAALWSLAQRTDLARHVADRQGADAPKLRSDLQIAKASNGQQIGIVMLTGPLMKAVGSMEAGTSTVQARRDLRKAANDPEVSAILIAIDSPGGTVAGTADLGAEIRAAAKKKPVWAYAADLCASAAFWAASQADKVFANDRTALVGSIGTLAVLYDLSAQAEQMGVKALVFGTGPLKGAGAPGAPVTEEQQTYFRGLVDDAQKSFDAAVKRGRGMTDAQLADAKTGGVFGASEALDRGLIDGIKTFDAVMEDLAAEARRARRESQQTRAAGPDPQRSATVEETVTTTAGAPAAPAVQFVQTAPQPAPDPMATFRTQMAEDARRVGAIQAAAKQYGVTGDAVAAAIEKGTSARDFEFDAMKASLAGNGVRPFAPHAIVRDNGANIEALQGAILLRAGGKLDSRAYGTQAGAALNLPGWLRADVNDAERNRRMDQAHRFSHLSLIDLCREAVRLDGKEPPLARSELVAVAVSGGTLTNIFTTSVNAKLITGYLEAPDTTQGWTASADLADFKQNDRIRLETLGGSLPKLPRGATADHERRSDKSESYKIARYASQFVVDEQDFIDDSMESLQRMPADMAGKAARLRPDLVYSILLSNPGLTATGRALFNSTDGNLGTTSPLSAATLRAAISSFMLVRDNQVNLNLMPTHLIVPPSLVHVAKELVNSQMIMIAGTAGTVTERGTVNTIADYNLQVVVDGRLENGVVDPDSGATNVGSSTTWYLASTQAPTIEVGYLRGTGRVPQVRSFTLDKGQWGIGWDVKMDIGAKAMDWRGLRKTTA